ncbi:ABC transporter substrate-binding protein [Cellvibrio japonicus]|uniref:Putative dibenzothiophene desulfurization enzyme B n=1 Tax=Cellvibrio japonicus (strain Ueda107) TaxID=498211 RepID=B3PJV5_CELJU|nr:ABC transporter substrate-binding protein [Cellvibrio japonicus]ACE84724.1 putative dibenzothiophene desulfurization enzyme B [Cellvibrio japonicus Ueda107]QEI12736.1 ABC transporter substrate-binding protein [Cellvibrio japonicus]QEI16310.1 ABC transporter substrate-binding protein [Cellvibrio japonicus]QEI19888.1 ABC transporter substrate-binding protein [Cellvibrio japonicus]
MTQQDLNTVELWYTRCGAATASALAIRKGWLQEEFAKPGTTLHSLRESHSLATRNSHYNHNQSGMFREGGNIPPIWAKGSGQDTVVVGITWLDEYQGILTRADSGIRTVADLKGKRLGVPLHRNAVIDFQRGAAQHGYETALRLADLSVEDVTLVDIEAPSYDTQDGPRREPRESGRSVEVAALEAGEVDAIFLRFARGYRLSQDPRFHQVININDLPDHLLRVNNGTPRPVTVDRAFLEKNPEVVVRYLAVLLETADWAREHPDEVIELLRADGSDITREEVIGSHGDQLHLHFEPKLIPEYVLGLEVQKDFLHRWGYFEKDFSVRTWIEYWPLARAQKLYEERKAARAANKAA